MGDLESRENALKKLAYSITGERILDIATGSGYLAAALLGSSPNASVVCLDIDSKQLRKTRSELLDIKCVCADANHLPFKPSSFDCTVTWSALVHIKEWRRVIDESFRVSKRMLTAEPHGAFSVRAFRDFKCRHEPPSIKELQAAFEKHGKTGVKHMESISLVCSKH